jgi:hypothetical protein
LTVLNVSSIVFMVDMSGFQFHTIESYQQYNQKGNQ